MPLGIVSEAGAWELWRTSLGAVFTGSASSDAPDNERLLTLRSLLDAFDKGSSRLRVVE
jgi:hypothetical protein